MTDAPGIGSPLDNAGQRIDRCGGARGGKTAGRVRRFSSNLFSAGMIGLAAAAGGVTLNATLRYGFHSTGAHQYHSFIAVAIALLPATAVHVLLNVGLLSRLFALRSNTSFWQSLKENLSWAAPIALPTSAVASREARSSKAR